MFESGEGEIGEQEEEDDEGGQRGGEEQTDGYGSDLDRIRRRMRITNPYPDRIWLGHHDGSPKHHITGCHPDRI